MYAITIIELEQPERHRPFTEDEFFDWPPRDVWPTFWHRAADPLLEDVDEHSCDCGSPIGWCLNEDENGRGGAEWVTAFLVSNGDWAWLCCESCVAPVIDPPRPAVEREKRTIASVLDYGLQGL